MTPTHPLRLASGELKRARDVQPGDKILALLRPPSARNAAAAAAEEEEEEARVEEVEVTGVEHGAHKVKYVLTAHDSIVVDGVVAPTQSTMLGALELLPFKLLDALHLLALPPVRAALYAILESPLLASAEVIADKALPVAARKVAGNKGRSGMEVGVGEVGRWGSMRDVVS